MTNIQRDEIYKAYEDVRSDSSEIIWAAICYDDNEKIVLSKTGIDFQELLAEFSEAGRVFGYLRVTAGDELSKRAKFVLITYIGENVTALKKAKMSTDKSIVKSVIQNFSIELLFEGEEGRNIKLEDILETVRKAGGANYGTGQRDA